MHFWPNEWKKSISTLNLHTHKSESFHLRASYMIPTANNFFIIQAFGQKWRYLTKKMRFMRHHQLMNFSAFSTNITLVFQAPCVCFVSCELSHQALGSLGSSQSSGTRLCPNYFLFPPFPKDKRCPVVLSSWSTDSSSTMRPWRMVWADSSRNFNGSLSSFARNPDHPSELGEKTSSLF